MPVTINEAIDVMPHRREPDGSATPLRVATDAGLVAYVNDSPEAGFSGSTAAEALDELFRRLKALEG